MLVLAAASCGNRGKQSSTEQPSGEFAGLEESYNANPADTSALKALARAYAGAGRIDDAIDLAVKLGAVVDESSDHMTGLYEQGMFMAELYRSVGDEESAQMALEDARIFISRQAWGELSEEEKALMEKLLENIEIEAGGEQGE